MRLGDAVPFTGKTTSTGLAQTVLPLLLACLVGAIGGASSAEAQPFRAGNTFYLKFGAGLSDYAGGNSGTLELDNTTDLAEFFDTRKFTDGEVFPYALSGEIGYHFSPALGIGLGYQFGQYPFASGVPFTTNENIIGRGGDLGTVRHTIQLLGRYMFGAKGWLLSPYLDAGINASFGGFSTGVGPLVGAGLDLSLTSRTSLFLESRVNVTFDDEATDGIDGGDPFDALSALPSLGLRYTFSPPAVPPRVIALDGPAEVQAGESATFSARINEAKALRPLTYQWKFGDGRTASGLTASHTYNESGTFDVTFTARNDAGVARDSLSVTVTSPPRPARILSVNAEPNPAQEGEIVRFESEVDGASPLTFEWNFGNGETGFGASPTHTYEEPGEYTVQLTASNEDGEDQASLTVQVERALPAVCETVREFNSVYFDYGSSQLTSGAKQKLQENVDVLRKCPNLSVRVEGFAAPGEPNGQELSEARAQAAAAFYEEKGLAPDRFQTSGEGRLEGETGKKGDTRQFRRVDTVLLNDGGASEGNN